MNSLLYKSSCVSKQVNEKTVFDLQLDKILRNISSDIRIRDVFINILSYPLSTKNDIIYRQNILKDFLISPSLLSEFQALFERLIALEKDYNKARRENARSFHDTLSKDDVHESLGLLKLSALNLKRMLLWVKACSDLLGRYNIVSEGILNIKTLSDQICMHREYEELLHTCSYLTSISETAPIDVKISIGRNGKIQQAELISHKYVRITDPNLKEKKYLFKKNNTAIFPCSQLHYKVLPTKEKLLSSPFQSICSIIETISTQIFDKFVHYEKEYKFYQMAIEYCMFLKNAGYSLVFPKISDTKCTEIQSLYDLYLITERYHANVIPNDLFLSETQKGIAVFGKNSGGKTVFLRSIGAAQLFAQAGLPIPASSASIYPYANIITQFAREEVVNLGSEDAGRFEQEVINIAKIIENNTNNTLILFNEVFQSTSYEEGAEGLSNILEYLNFTDNKWIIVSHMLQIKKYLSNDVSILNVKNNYVIE